MPSPTLIVLIAIGILGAFVLLQIDTLRNRPAPDPASTGGGWDPWGTPTV